MAYQQPPGYTPYAGGQPGYPPPQQGYQPAPNYAPPVAQQQAHTNVVVVQQPAQRVSYDDCFMILMCTDTVRGGQYLVPGRVCIAGLYLIGHNS